MKKDTKSKQPRRTIVKTLSLPAEIAEAGDARRLEELRTFSNYVATLIERDVKESKLAAA
jgi:hypothetical protein